MRFSTHRAAGPSGFLAAEHRLYRISHLLSVAAPALLLCLSPAVIHGQNGLSAPPRPNSILLPEANRTPDANAVMEMQEARQKKQNFDAANALRQKKIDDETIKLVYLAKDLKDQMDQLGDKPVPEQLLREAEVIELLARDVQIKMILTVKGG